MQHSSCVNLASYEGYPNDSSTRMAFDWNVLLAVEWLKPTRDSDGFSVLSPMDLLRGRESPGITASDGTHPFGSVSDHVLAENSSPADVDGGNLWCRQPVQDERTNAY